MLGSMPLQPLAQPLGAPLLDLPRVMPGLDVLAQPHWCLSVVSELLRCFHQPANVFWPKARIPGFFPTAARNSDLAWCWVCYSWFGGRGVGGPAPKRPLSGKAPASSPWSLGVMAEPSSTCLVWAVPWTSLWFELFHRPVCCHSPQAFVATCSYVSKRF